MSLRNETREAFQSTKSFYKEYTSGMTRKRLERDLHADSSRIKALYREAVGENEENHVRIGPHIKLMRLFNALSKRLNPTRRLIFGASIFGFFLHYFSTGFLATALLPLSFAGLLMVLMLELLEKMDVKKEIDLAREIQLSLLPPSETSVNDINISSFANTANEVGGDYVDVINTPKGTYVIIADVSGKGLTAALYMVRIQAMAHLIINQSSPSPKKLLLELNNYIKSGKGDKTFVTACVTFFPVNEDHFVFARAGHNSPILYKKDKDTTLTLRTPGLALGMANSSQLDEYLKETTVDFKSGDSLILYTDGLTEARNFKGDEYGINRLQSLVDIYGVLDAKSMNKKIQFSLDSFIGEEKQYDDITFTCIHKK